MLRPEFKVALELLLDARLFAADVSRSPWDFALEIARLHEVGLNDTDLRWLVCKDYATPAVELICVNDSDRSFGEEGGLRFEERTCFVLTQNGAKLADLFSSESPKALVGIPSEIRVPNATVNNRPDWNMDSRTLSVGERIVKRYRVPAANQEKILNAFNEDDWPARIDDPLPPVGDTDPKRRLQSTITCLNRNQRNRLIRFAGDGCGTGIIWELADAK